MFDRYKLPILQIALAFLFMIIMTRPALAEHGYGVRAGASADPNQFYFGGHFDVAEVAKRFWFRPNLEIGFGDGLTVVAINGEFVYRVPLRGKTWETYFGAGPSGVISTLHDADTDYKSDAGVGFNFLLGLQKPKGFLTEVKFGLGDSPAFKIGVGWSW
jgi:hypothetical protein